MKKTALITVIILLLTAVYAVGQAAEKGDTVTFGSYPQGAGGEAAPIEWTVLDIDDDGYCVLLSVYGLDAKPYNEAYEYTSWEKCTLRAWLNGEFFDTAFTPDEQAMIKTVTLVNGDNPVWKSHGGSDTEDRVYLLSLDEMTEYYGITKEQYNAVHDDLCCAPTEYAAANGAFVYDSDGNAEFAEYDGNGTWWLRSPGSNEKEAAAVYRDGNIHENGNGVPSASTCARPVIRVRFE